MFLWHLSHAPSWYRGPLTDFLGAFHGAEMAFDHGMWERMAPDERRLSAFWMTAMGAFVWTGHPGGERVFAPLVRRGAAAWAGVEPDVALVRNAIAVTVPEAQRRPGLPLSERAFNRSVWGALTEFVAADGLGDGWRWDDAVDECRARPAACAPLAPGTPPSEGMPVVEMHAPPLGPWEAHLAPRVCGALFGDFFDEASTRFVIPRRAHEPLWSRTINVHLFGALKAAFKHKWEVVVALGGAGAVAGAAVARRRRARA
jgi:hypothetical protein